MEPADQCPNFLILEKPSELSNSRCFARVVREENTSNLIGFKFTTQYCRVLDVVQMCSPKCDPNNLWVASNLKSVYDVDFLIDIRRIKTMESGLFPYSRLYRTFHLLNRFSPNSHRYHLKKITLVYKNPSNVDGLYRVLLFRENGDFRLLVVNSHLQVISIDNILNLLKIECNNSRSAWMFECVEGPFDYVINIEGDKPDVVLSAEKRIRACYSADVDPIKTLKKAKLDIESQSNPNILEDSRLFSKLSLGEYSGIPGNSMDSLGNLMDPEIPVKLKETSGILKKILENQENLEGNLKNSNENPEIPEVSGNPGIPTIPENSDVSSNQENVQSQEMRQGESQESNDKNPENLEENAGKNIETDVPGDQENLDKELESQKDQVQNKESLEKESEAGTLQNDSGLNNNQDNSERSEENPKNVEENPKNVEENQEDPKNSSETPEVPGNLEESSKDQEKDLTTQKEPTKKRDPPVIIAICLTCGGIIQNHYKCFHCCRIFLENPGEPGEPGQKILKPVSVKLELEMAIK